jgi:hypothetical protein
MIPQMPNFKSTKWKTGLCKTCEAYNHASDTGFAYDCLWGIGCLYAKHQYYEIDNFPFFVPDMKIDRLFFKGWARLESKILNKSFLIGPTKFEELILNTKIDNLIICGMRYK